MPRGSVRLLTGDAGATPIAPADCHTMDNDSTKEEIRRSVRIEDVVSEHVPLQRAGRRLKACCPFHQEKTPSFYVNPDLGLYKCFGCGVGGDLFDFVMRIEHITFPEAAERLAERAGLQWQSSPGDEARAKRSQLARRANQIAADFFEQTLHSREGKVGLDYLLGRGFSEAIIRHFRLGYAPDAWDALLRHLRQRGIDPVVAAEAGLAKEGASGGHYDVFRNRVMFPIIDSGNRIIGFGGRALSADDPAKYLNTPDTPMFKKGRNVYALNLAGAAISRAKQAILVEGYTDVIALHQAGIENVVACLGTALTQDHLNLLSRYAEEIILAYDADAAGMNAAARNIPMLERCPAQVSIVLLPPGLDPDECVRERGPQAFLEVLKDRRAPVEYEIDLLFAQYRDRGPEGVAMAARQVVDVLLRVPDRARQDEYLARAADHWGEGNPGRTSAMQGSLKMELRRRAAERGGAGPRARADSPRDRAYQIEAVSRLAAKVPDWVLTAERQLLRAALTDERLARDVFASVDADRFSDGPHQTIARAVAERIGSGQPWAPAEVIEHLRDDEAAYETALQFAMDELSEEEQEVIPTDIANLRTYHESGRYRGHYEVPVDDELPPPAPVEDFEELRRKVIAKINAGEDSPDDPDIILFQQWVTRMRGAGAS